MHGHIHICSVLQLYLTAAYPAGHIVQLTSWPAPVDSSLPRDPGLQPAIS
jgi:hypothetical protein